MIIKDRMPKAEFSFLSPLKQLIDRVWYNKHNEKENDYSRVERRSIMKKGVFITAIIMAIAMSVFTGCSGGKTSEINTQPEPTQAATAAYTTIKPTEPTTAEPTTEPPAPTEFSRADYLRSGYWCCYDGGTSMYAYTFEAESTGHGKYFGHCHIYDVKNNEVIERNEENTHEHNTNAIINYEITDDSVLLTEEGGLESELKFTEDNDVLIRNTNGKEERYHHFSSVPDYDELQALVSSQNNQSDKKEKSKEDILNSGIWVKYSPQAPMFETYAFSDGIIEHKEYMFDNGSVREYNSGNTRSFMTYTVDDNGVTIRDDKSREWTYYFTDDEGVLERTYQDTYGNDTFTATEKMYHHDSLPSYETAKEQSNKRG